MNPSATMSTVDTGMTTNGAAGYSGQRSAMALRGSLGASTLSMRAKAARKRRINTKHNSNFHAGFVPVEEDRLQRTGIRGRKRYFLYCLVGTLLGVTFLNLAVTSWLLYTLGMTHDGLYSMEIISRGGENLMRVLTDASMDTVSLGNAVLGARFDSSLDIRSEDSELNIKSATKDSSSTMSLEGNTLTLTTKEFCIQTRSENGSSWVSANLRSMARQNIINNLSVDENITVRRIQEGNKYNDLSIESTQRDTAIYGHEGIDVTADKQIQITAKSDSVSLRAQNAINMSALDGIYIRPRVKGKIRDGDTYKVCICDTGRVFAVRSRSSCDIKGRKLKKICESETDENRKVFL